MFTNKEWWKDAVIYQIYPRSFNDTNKDGIGDLPGITEKLDYIKSLEVDAIWICPVCESPDIDNGYDCSNYREIDPRYGNMEDMRTLITEARRQEMGIIIDLVLNHTSDKHYWFQSALSSRESQYRNFYVWSDGIIDSHGILQPPNELRSNFGGSAWEYHQATEQYYLHLHDSSQPDLNWKNPKTREAMYEVIRFWVNEGVAGFRLDVIDLLGKEPLSGITQNGPQMHDFIQGIAEQTFAGHSFVSVGEAWGANPQEALKFIEPKRKELNMIFQFEPMQLDKQDGGKRWDLAPLDKVAFKKTYEKWQHQLQDAGWNALFANNHDLPRVVSRWGNDTEYWSQSAKALATLLYLMKGTPFIFQGEEIGMTNVPYESIDKFMDIESLNAWNDRVAKGIPEQEVLTSIRAKGRENGRTPMQWSNAEKGGFTQGIPWYDLNPNYTHINVAAQEKNKESILNYYRDLLKYRKGNEIIRRGSFELYLRDHPEIFVYRRVLNSKSIWVLANMSNTPTALKFLDIDGITGKAVLMNYQSSEKQITTYLDEKQDIVLKPWECWVIED